MISKEDLNDAIDACDEIPCEDCGYVDCHCNIEQDDPIIISHQRYIDREIMAAIEQRELEEERNKKGT